MRRENGSAVNTSNQETAQATEMHELRMRLLAELRQPLSSIADARAAVDEAANKLLAGAKSIANADHQRGITAAQHQQIVKAAEEARLVSIQDEPYYAALGHLLKSGRGASGGWGDERVSDKALETILEAHSALLATVCILHSTAACVCACNTYVICDQYVP